MSQTATLQCVLRPPVPLSPVSWPRVMQVFCRSRRGEGKTLSSSGVVHWNQGDLFVFPMFHEGQSADHKAGKEGAALYFVRSCCITRNLRPGCNLDEISYLENPRCLI